MSSKAVIFAMLVAYIATGAIYVFRKLREENPLRVSPYFFRYRREGGIGLLIQLVLSWPFAATLNTEWGYWLAFVVLAGAALLLAS